MVPFSMVNLELSTMTNSLFTKQNSTSILPKAKRLTRKFHCLSCTLTLSSFNGSWSLKNLITRSE
jgi:hypothetical protein